MSANEDEPARPKRRNVPVFAFLAMGVVALLVAFGWGAANLNYYGAAHSVPHQMVAWSAAGEDSIEVTFQVSGTEPVACLVRALDERHVEVGEDEIQVDAGNREVTHSVRTTREATSAEVVSCRAVEGAEQEN
jgi:hypothetical protein